MKPILEVIAGFGPGNALGVLELVAATTAEQVDNNDSLTATVVAPTALTLRQRSKLRFTGSDGRVREYRVRRLSRNSTARTVDIEAGPVWLDLATAGAVRVTTGTATTFTIDATLSASDWLTTYVVSDVAAVGLTWLDTTLGTIEATGTRRLSFQNATRLEILQAVAAAFQCEWQIAQVAPGGLYRVSLWTQRGAANGVANITRARELLAFTSDSGDDQLATGVMVTGITPAGDTNPATVADNLWRIADINSGWVTLADPAGGAGPIGVDDLVNNLWLFGPLSGGGAPFGVQITDSRAADHAVQPTTTAGLSVGDLVSIRATADGRGVFELESPTAGPLYDRVIATQAQENGRGEANRLKDGRFASGLTEWAAVNPPATPAFAEIQRSELGTTTGGAIATARAAGTGTGTALQLKGRPANSWVRQQDQIVVAGNTATITADAIPDATGALTFTVTPGLPGTYADNTPVVVVRRRSSGMVLAESTPVLSPYMRFTDNGAADPLWLSQPVTLSRDAFPTTTTMGVGASWENTNPLIPYDGGAFQTFGVSYYSQSVDASYQRTVAALSSADGWTLGATLDGGSDGHARFVVAVDKTALALASIPWLATVGHVIRSFNGSFGPVMNLTRSSGAVVTLSSTDWPAICESVVDSGATWTVTYRYWVPSGFTRVAKNVTPFTGTDVDGVFYWDLITTPGTAFYPVNDAWTLSSDEGAFNFNLNGSHPAGTTTVNIKANAAIAPRNFNSGDTVGVFTYASATMAWTSFSAAAITTPFAGTRYTFTITAASSTIDEMAATWPGKRASFRVGGGVTTAGALQIISVTGTTVIAEHYTGQFTAPVFAATGAGATLEGTFTQTYSVTAAANWGANGQVTVSVSPAVPVGITHPKGSRATPNFNPDNSRFRLAAQVTAGATSFTLRGAPSHFGTSPVTLPTTGTWTLPPLRFEANRATIPFAGDTLTAAASAQADGSGNVSVTLAAANTNALAVDQAITVTRPAILRSTDPTAGSVVRLLSAIGGTSIPTNTTPGIRSHFFRAEVPAGATRLVTVYATVAMTAGTYALGQLPAVAILDGSGTVLASTRFANNTVTVGAVVYGTMIAQATLTESAALAVAVYGGFTNTPTLWHVLLEAWAVQSAATDVPFVQGSHANALWLAALKYLQIYARAVTKLSVTVAQLQEVSGLPLLPVTPVVGQTITQEDTGESVRLAAVRYDHFDYTRTEWTLDTLRPTAARLLGVK